MIDTRKMLENEMLQVRTQRELRKATKWQGGMMPVGNYVIATRHAWNYDRHEMGFTAFLYLYTSENRDADATLSCVIASCHDMDDFHTEAEAGSWAFGMLETAIENDGN